MIAHGGYGFCEICDDLSFRSLDVQSSSK